MYAASLIQSGDTVYLDCGTTLSYMAAALAERIKNEDLLPLNIVTNSIANLQILSEVPLCKVVLTGGVYNANRRDFSGPLTERYIRNFHFGKPFSVVTAYPWIWGSPQMRRKYPGLMLACFHAPIMPTFYHLHRSSIKNPLFLTLRRSKLMNSLPAKPRTNKFCMH